MTKQADLMIDLLTEKKLKGADLTIEKTAHALALLSFRPTEIGWVLRHLFGLTMPDAVHRATMMIEILSMVDEGFNLPVVDEGRGENGG